MQSQSSINLRVNRQFRDVLENAAEYESMNLSELARQALREYLRSRNLWPPHKNQQNDIDITAKEVA